MKVFRRVAGWKYAKPTVFGLVFALAGVITLAATNAAVPTASIESEAGSKTSNASTVSDSSASGSSAVKFSASAQPVTCNLNATTANFASQVTAATAGQTVCLASGDYGTWQGTNKAITIAAAPGQTPTMKYSFGTGDSGFTLRGMSNMGGLVNGTANNITVRDSTFSTTATFVTDSMTNANIVFDNNQHPAFVGTTRIHAYDNGSARATPTGVAIKNSVFNNPGNIQGGADGVRCDGSSIEISGNDFSGVRDADSGNHGDPIQIYGGVGCVIRGNFFHDMINSATCSLGQWDGGESNIFENNVVHTGGCYEAVAFMADHNSLVAHNTFVAPPSGCLANPQAECGSLFIGAKSGFSGSGTVIRDNVMTYISVGNSATFSSHHNLCQTSCGGTGGITGTPTMVGGAHPTTWAGFKLAPGSPGYGAASDGLNMGIN